MNRAEPTLLFQKVLDGFEVSLRHEDVHLVCPRINDSRRIGVASIDGRKLLGNEWDGTHIGIIPRGGEGRHTRT